MINKVNRPLLFLYTFIFTIIILMLTLYVTFFSLGSHHWLLDIWRAIIYKMPLIIYVIILALIVSTIVTGIVYVLEKKEFTSIEKKINLLAKGAFEETIFFEHPQGTEADLTGVNYDIQNIHKNMLEMSRELQAQSSRPTFVGEFTKEEIVKEERQRLARELHDSVSQQLFAASMLLSAVKEDKASQALVPALSKQIAMVETIINDSQAEMRALLLHLRPINLEGKRLKKGIEQLLLELKTKVKIDLTWDVTDLSLNNGVEDNLFRIVQELLSNTLRHSKANSLEVYLQQVENNVLLRFIDDGVGFDATQTSPVSYGLSNIKERAASMGGSCKIISFKDKGTSIEIRVPYIEGEISND